MIQRILWPVWLRKVLGTAIIQSCTIIFSCFGLKLIFLHEDELLLSVLFLPMRTYLCWCSQNRKSEDGFFHNHLKGSNKFLFKIERKCTEIVFWNGSHWNLKSVILIIVISDYLLFCQNAEMAFSIHYISRSFIYNLN